LLFGKKRFIWMLMFNGYQIRQFLPGSEGVGERRRGWGEREAGEGGRSDPNIVCTYE
jgi:hypothetical protein